jgi:DNA primase
MSAEAAVRRTDLVALMTELAGQPSGRAGANRWHCVVPEHDDENPSTTVFEDSHGKQRWKCWSCGHGGTAIDALMEARSMSLADAITNLEERTVDDDTPAPRTPSRPAVPQTVALSDAARIYVSACAEQLWTADGAPALNWLHARGLTDAVLRDNLVGFDPGPSVVERPAGLPGHMTDTPRLAGGTGVTFVAFGSDGEPIHVQCRLLDPGTYKYVNPRREHGSIPAVSFPRTQATTGPIIVTEGTPDGLIAVTAGFRAATVTAATTVRQSTADQLVKHAAGNRIVLAFDNDDAGNAATRQLKDLLGPKASVLQLPTGNDLTTTYQKRTAPPCPTLSTTIAMSR